MKENSPINRDSLISELKAGHELILGLLPQVQAVAHNYILAKPLLRQLSDVLLNHFEKQNRYLVSFLQEIMASHDENSALAHFLFQDLKEIKIKVWFFIDEHPSDMGDIYPKNFLADFKDLFLSLVARIKTEQEQLMPLIEKRFS